MRNFSPRAFQLGLTATVCCGLATGTAHAQAPTPAEASVPATVTTPESAAPAPSAALAVAEPSAAASVVSTATVAAATPPIATATLAAPTKLAQVASAASADVTAKAPPSPTAAAAPAATSLVDALVGGKISASMRYRFEYLDREDLPAHSRLSTLRIALGYETKPFFGVSLFGEFEGVTNIGPTDYRVPTADSAFKQNLEGKNPRRPLAADPIGNELNQAMLKYTSKLVNVKLGRQNLPLNNARFISFSGWRQANQTMDAANLDVAPVKGFNLNYIFIAQANRVVGHDALDGQLEMATHVGNVTWKKPGVVNLAVFNIYLDYRELPILVDTMGVRQVNATTGLPVRLADQSSNSLGFRVDGPYQLNADWTLLYAVDFAHQRDIASNPLAVQANYYGAEFGVAYQGFGLRVQYNVRQGVNNFATEEAFQTPLSHPWDGWTENFLRTPKTGLRIAAAHLAGPIPGVAGLTLTTAYYEYFADKTGRLGATAPAFTAGDHYGREFDAGLEYRFVGLDKNWMIGARIAYYDDDKLMPKDIPIGAANLRTSAYTMYSF